MSTGPICGVICHLCGAPHKSNFLVMEGKRGYFMLLYMHKFG